MQSSKQRTGDDGNAVIVSSDRQEGAAESPPPLPSSTHPAAASAASAASPTIETGGGCSGRIKSFDELLASYAPDTNRSFPVMTRFERAKVLGLRTEQLARGAEPSIPIEDDPSSWDPSEVAQRELDAKTLPFVIVRSMPDGTKEMWKIRDLALLLPA